MEIREVLVAFRFSVTGSASFIGGKGFKYFCSFISCSFGTNPVVSWILALAIVSSHFRV